MPSDRPSSAPETPETVPSTGQDDATSLFRALGSRNYRLFFAGQAVSLTGFWMQKVATGWLVYRLTHSPLALGVVDFAGSIPLLLLTPFTGALLERWNLKNTFFLCQAHDAQQPQKAEGRPGPESGLVLAGATGSAAIAAHAGLARRHLQGEDLAVFCLDVEFHHLARLGRLARGHAAQHQVARRVAHRHLARGRHKRLVVLGLLLLGDAPCPAHGERQHRHAADHGEPDAQIKAAGEGVGQGHAWGEGRERRRRGACVSDQSCCLANT